VSPEFPIHHGQAGDRIVSTVWSSAKRVMTHSE
jgi:hypothetical protein